MKLTAITMVKDEIDVIERTLRHMRAQGVDEILIYENESSDGTWELLRDMRDSDALAPMHLVIYPDPVQGYYQSQKMTRLAAAALEGGADWIVPFDADELWTVLIGGETPGHLNTIRHLLRGHHTDDIGVIPFENYNHYRTDVDPGGHPFDAMGWRSREPLPLPKVLFRATPRAVVEAGNHGVTGVPGRVVPMSGLRIHHYPYRSEEQFIRKARNGSAAYAATDLPRSTGQHWREWGDTLEEHGEDGLRTWYREAFTYRNPLASGLVHDPVRSPP